MTKIEREAFTYAAAFLLKNLESNKSKIYNQIVQSLDTEIEDKETFNKSLVTEIAVQIGYYIQKLRKDGYPEDKDKRKYYKWVERDRGNRFNVDNPLSELAFEIKVNGRSKKYPLSLRMYQSEDFVQIACWIHVLSEKEIPSIPKYSTNSMRQLGIHNKQNKTIEYAIEARDRMVEYFKQESNV